MGDGGYYPGGKCPGGYCPRSGMKYTNKKII